MFVLFYGKYSLQSTTSAADPFNFDTTVCKHGNQKIDCSILVGWPAGWLVGWLVGWLGWLFMDLYTFYGFFKDLVS